MAISKSALKAIDEINDILSNKSNKELNGKRINYRKDMTNLKNMRVLFSNDVYFKLCKMVLYTRNAHNGELATFLYGNIEKDVLYFDTYKSDFVSDNNNLLKMSEDNYNELMSEIKNHNTVMHFHTYPEFYKNLQISDRDLLAFATLQKNFQPANSRVLYLGGVAGINKGNTKFSVVSYDPANKDFLNFPNVYYEDKDKIYKLDNNFLMEDNAICKEFEDSMKEKVKIIKNKRK